MKELTEEELTTLQRKIINEHHLPVKEKFSTFGCSSIWVIDGITYELVYSNSTCKTTAFEYNGFDDLVKQSKAI